MKISQDGINLIKEFEGCYLTEYKDAVGVLTIGYGHTGNVKENQRITQAAAEALLKDDLERFEKAVDKYVTVTINQHQFDALVSFSFNCGSGALSKSTLLKKVNAKDFDGAKKEFAKWNKAGGKVLNGLTRRREAEAELFAKPVPSTFKLIKKGSTDREKVKQIQRKLNIKVDGIFGNGTYMAVRNFQVWHNLHVDGIVGKNTWNKMF